MPAKTQQSNLYPHAIYKDFKSTFKGAQKGKRMESGRRGKSRKRSDSNGGKSRIR